jgi:beta-glucosidase
VDFDDHEGAELVDATPPAGDAVQARDGAGAVTLLFREVDLAGVGGLAAEVSRTAPGEAAIEVRVGGTLLATLAVPSTGERYAWTAASVPLADVPEGVHDVTLTLCGEQRLRAFTFEG